MRDVGVIKFVQVQRSPMKIWTEEDRVYRTDPLQIVQQLRLMPEGIIGVVDDGSEVIDAHHADHPESRNRGMNGISIGFTQNYGKIRGRFGDHIVDGAAAENIIVDATLDLAIFSSAQQCFIRSAASGQLIELQAVLPAPPCREFSIFCLQGSGNKDEIKSALQFLDHGMRGYYAKIDPTEEPVLVQAGDTLLIE